MCVHSGKLFVVFAHLIYIPLFELNIVLPYIDKYINAYPPVCFQYIISRQAIQ